MTFSYSPGHVMRDGRKVEPIRDPVAAVEQLADGVYPGQSREVIFESAPSQSTRTYSLKVNGQNRGLVRLSKYGSGWFVEQTTLCQ